MNECLISVKMTEKEIEEEWYEDRRYICLKVWIYPQDKTNKEETKAMYN